MQQHGYQRRSINSLIWTGHQIRSGMSKCAVPVVDIAVDTTVILHPLLNCLLSQVSIYRYPVSQSQECMSAIPWHLISVSSFPLTAAYFVTTRFRAWCFCCLGSISSTKWQGGLV